MSITRSEKAMLKKQAKDNRKRLDEIIDTLEEETLTADGFDAAVIGVTEDSPVRVIYDHHTCVRVLMADGMDEEDAMEHMSFNVTGAYVGEHTPIFIHSL